MVKQQSWFLFSLPSFHKISPVLTIGILSTLIGGATIRFAPVSRGMASPQSQLSHSERGLGTETWIAQAQAPLLQLGSEGPEVQHIQTLLQLLGYYPGLINGQYQEETVAAVSVFQEAAGLNRDGIVGPTTWEKLLPSVTQVSDSQTVLSPSVSTASASSASVSEEPESSPAEDTQQTVSNSSETEDSASTPTDTTPTDTTTTPPEDIRLPTLRLGMRGPAVRNLQERLRALGLLEGTIDGIFGSQTEASVKSAQRYFNLTPDGVVGTATWRALLQ